VFYGQVVAETTASPAEDAAFVVYSDSSLALTPLSGGTFTARKVAKQDSYEYTRDAKKWTLSVPDEGLFDVMSASAFKLGQSEYIYVRWKPDTGNNYGGCDRQFSLFSIEQELRLVIASRSGCDV
jgi:flavin reductase (DIM6/NTAB) family NADH-FMN oxidoreductase RutF